MQDLGTRILRSIELKDHPLWIWNTRIRSRVEFPDIIVREPKVNRTDVVLELICFPGSDDYAANSRTTEHP